MEAKSQVCGVALSSLSCLTVPLPQLALTQADMETHIKEAQTLSGKREAEHSATRDERDTLAGRLLEEEERARIAERKV